jgi:hypothetical protein
MSWTLVKDILCTSLCVLFLSSCIMDKTWKLQWASLSLHVGPDAIEQFYLWSLSDSKMSTMLSTPKSSCKDEKTQWNVAPIHRKLNNWGPSLHDTKCVMDRALGSLLSCHKDGFPILIGHVKFSPQRCMKKIVWET